MANKKVNLILRKADQAQYDLIVPVTGKDGKITRQAVRFIDGRATNIDRKLAEQIVKMDPFYYIEEIPKQAPKKVVKKEPAGEEVPKDVEDEEEPDKIEEPKKQSDKEVKDK